VIGEGVDIEGDYFWSPPSATPSAGWAQACVSKALPDEPWVRITHRARPLIRWIADPRF